MKDQGLLFDGPGIMIRTAVLSDCGTYRYRLGRCWDTSLPELRWIMLNPSTADSAKDDPTVRKCIGFATRWGFGAIQIVNLFAFRATKPRDLMHTTDPIGPDNDQHLSTVLRAPVVAAWGGSLPRAPFGRMAVERILAMAPRDRWWCLGTTKGGEPHHPLILSYNTPRESWPERTSP